MAEKPVHDINVDEIWVNVTEGAELLGYHRMTVFKVAQANWKLPEEDREIKVKRHTSGYMIWLPDLIKYSEQTGRAPQPKRKHLST
jgi:hypothetical protein